MGNHVYEEGRRQALAACNVYAVLSDVFATEPTDAALSAVEAVAGLLGVSWEHVDASEAFVERYAERFAVPGSSLYVPLTENCVRMAGNQEGVLAFGPVDGAYREHVTRCYAAAGFVPALVLGHDDSLAAELSFMSYLAHAQVSSENEETFAAAEEWQRRFLIDHLLAWSQKAADALARAEDDAYARAANLVAAWCRVDAERVGRAA